MSHRENARVAEAQKRPSLTQEAKNEFKAAMPTCLGCGGKDAVFCRLFTDNYLDTSGKITASASASAVLKMWPVRPPKILAADPEGIGAHRLICQGLIGGQLLTF